MTLAPSMAIGDKETITRARSGFLTGSAVHALLKDGALAGQWVLDPRRSTISLRSMVIGLIPVKGIFGEVSGYGTVSADGEVSGTIMVAAASIDTKNSKRDRRLRSGQVFDSDNHPQITFTADSIRPAGQGVTVTGTLTVRGRNRPLSMDAVTSVSGDEEIWLDTKTDVNRGDFGIGWKSAAMASMTSTLTMHAVFARK
jgi:polyisoprenoid-binding protein YceI